MNSAYLSFLAANRRFLGYGFAMAWCSSYGQTYFISVFGGHIRDEFGLTHGEFGLVYSGATLASGLCLIWLGRQIDRFDLRGFSAAICAGLVGACLLIGWAETVAALTVAAFALRLAGQGLMSHTALTSMARYFDADRGKAISIANLGFPAGQAVFPLIGVALAGAIGWREAWFAMAAVLALAFTPLILWLLKGHVIRHSRLLDRVAAGGSARTGGGDRQWSLAEVRRDARFWLIQPAVLSLSFIGTGIIFHQVHLAEVKGWSLAWFAGSHLVMAASAVATALFAGPMVDRISATRLMAPYLLPSMVALALLAAGDAPAIAPLYMAGYGISVGLSRVVLGALWAEWYGVVHLGAIRALIAALMVIGSALSPVLMGWLIDVGVTMDAIIWMCVAYLAIAVGLVLAALRRVPAVA